MSQPDAVSGIKTYKLSPTWVARIKKRMIVTSGIIWGIALVGFIGLMVYSIITAVDTISRTTFLVMTPCMLVFLAGAAAGSAWIRVHTMGKRLDGYEVSLDASSITVKSFEINPTSVRRDEITSISESRRVGLVIRTRDRFQGLLINPHVDNFEELRSILIEWHPLSPKPQRIIGLRLQTIVMLVFMAAICVSPTAYLTVPLWLIMTGGLGYLTYVSIRQPSLKTSWKVIGVASALFLFALISLRTAAAVAFTFPVLIAPYFPTQ